MKRITLASLVGLAVLAQSALAAPVTFEYLFANGGFPIAMSADGQSVTGNSPNWGAFRWTQAGGWVDLQRWPSAAPGGAPGISADGSTIASTIAGSDTSYVVSGLWTQATGWQQFMVPGGPPDIANIDRSYSDVYGLSGDGSTVVGLYWRSSGRAHAYRWTQAGGGVDLGSVLPGHASRANAVNFDGSVVVGWDESSTGPWRPAAWVNGAEVLLSDTTDATTNGSGEASAVNPAGTVVAGFQMNPATTTREPVLWTRTGGTWSATHFLGALAGTYPQGYGINEPHGVTADGSMVVGYCSFDGSPYYSTGFVWTAATGTIDVVTWLNNNGVYVDPGFYIQSCMAITPDGQWILGYGQDYLAPYTRRAFRIHNPNVAAVSGGPRVAGLALSAPAPNPSRGPASLAFTLPADTQVEIAIFDAAGRRVATPARGAFAAGMHAVAWDGLDLAGRPASAGLYWARLVTPQGSTTQRLVRIR